MHGCLFGHLKKYLLLNNFFCKYRLHSCEVKAEMFEPVLMAIAIKVHLMSKRCVTKDQFRSDNINISIIYRNIAI